MPLKGVDFSILVLIAANPNLNRKQLDAELGLSAPNLAVLLDRLAESGRVERARSNVDCRAQHLHFIPEGSEVTAQADAIAATMENEPLRVLSGAERALLIELLLKVARGRAAQC